MFKKRNAQGLSITTIIVAVIGLIIVVVLIALLTGRLGTFTKGLDESKTCENVCTSLGKDTDYGESTDTCSGRYMAGRFSDITGPAGDGSTQVCCCVER